MAEEMACIELVERVTDYLEDALTPPELTRLRDHLSTCDGCRAHVEQVRTAVRILQSTPAEQLSPEADDRLTVMFRGWAQAGSGR
jgi:anti-sigma factor RsiW